MRGFHLICLLITALFFTGCGTVGRNIAGIDNFDQVSGDLYRGAQPSRQGIQTLANVYHVKTIINLRDDADAREPGWAKEAGMTYVSLPLDAETVTEADAEKLLKALQEAAKPAFVHCHVGRDRTGLAVAAYRVRAEQWTLAAADKEMIDHGHFYVWFPKVRESLAQLSMTSAAVVRRGEEKTLTSAGPVTPTAPAIAVQPSPQN